MKDPYLHSHTLGVIVKFNDILLVIILFFSFSSIYSQQLAFPTAEGYGKFTTGGRGGSVIKVTNLNDSGSGSLREALLKPETRTVVFEVGGTISLKSNIYIYDGNVTVAGQTAPGDGVLIKGGMLQVEDSNVIIRNLRFRPGPTASSGTDGVSVTAWSGTVENIIFDHCSISWADDENFNLRSASGANVKNITLQNSIISESGYGVLLYKGTSNISLYGNLLAHNRERNLRSNNPIDGVLGWEMVNNIIYGYGEATHPSFGTKFSVLNNKYKESIETPGKNTIIKVATSGQGTPSETYAYVSGNIIPAGKTLIQPELEQYLEVTSFASSGIEAISAESLDSTLLSHIGASLPNRDAVDERLINQYKNGNGALATSGTYPTIAGGTSPIDTDEDGMPDFWEDENDLDKTDPSDGNIVQPDGYTNLEYYLNGLFFLNNGEVNANAGSDQNICEGSSVTLTASGGDSYLWSTGETSESITVTPNTTTTYSLTAFVDGESDSDDIIVNVNAIPMANAGSDQNICEGSSATLTASGGDSYLWSTGETSESITVTPNTTTTYSVVVNQNGCNDTDDVLVTVNSSPTTNAGTDVNILEGENTTLVASGGNSYLWNTGETTQSIIVNPANTTTYSVTAFNDNCEDTDDVIVNVYAIVSANAGNDVAICENSSTTLTASGGTDYLWNTGETTQSISVSPNTSTTYAVTVSNAMDSDTDEVIVTVNPSPTANAGNDVSILEGENTTLVANGGNSYLWNTGETTQSIIVTPANTTTYTVRVFNDNCGDTDEVIVNVYSMVSANAGNDVAICENSSTILTASGGTDYLWSTGETTQSITVSPNSTTAYTVIVSNAMDSDTDDVLVTVNPNPTASAGVNVSIFEGESTILTASGGGTYLWSTGETTQSITVSPNSTTTYSVIVLLNDCEDTDSVIVTVNLSEVTANAGGDVSICKGDSITLTASGGTDYLWNTGETTQSILVNPNATTNYTVLVSNDISSDTDDVTVQVNPVPEVSVSGDATILEGDYITLSASGANRYEWSNGAIEPNIAVSPSSTITYGVTGYINECYDVKDVTVNVVPQVVANAGEDLAICFGNETTLTATSSGGESYLWNTGETTESITVNPEEDTMYTVMVSNSLDSDADEILVAVNACQEVIIPEEDDFLFQVYTDSRTKNDKLKIKFAGLKNVCELYLFDISGRLIHSEPFHGNDGQEVVKTINTSSMSKGMYVVKINEQGIIHSKNIVIR